MSDWQVGDLAVRVRATDDPRNRAVMGAVYTVASVYPCIMGVGLTFVEIPHPNARGYVASSFRKIRPDEREACEPEFVTLLKRSRKTVRA